MPVARKLKLPSALTVSVPVGCTSTTDAPAGSVNVSLSLPKVTRIDVTPSAPGSSDQVPSTAGPPSIALTGVSDTTSVGRSSTIVTSNDPDAVELSLSVTVKPMPASRSLSSLPASA